MTKKLTGREAVIALMEGKKIKDNYVTFQLGYDQTEVLDDVGKVYGFNYFLKRNEFWLVQEPEVWEGEENVWEFESHITHGLVLGEKKHDVTTSFHVKVPETFANKRVKVRVEEIL